MSAPSCSKAALGLRAQSSVIILRNGQCRSGSRLLNLILSEAWDPVFAAVLRGVLDLNQGWNLSPASDPVAISDNFCFPQRVDLLFVADLSTCLQSRAVHRGGWCTCLKAWVSESF